jgi:hypothetical protein
MRVYGVFLVNQLYRLILLLSRNLIFSKCSEFAYIFSDILATYLSNGVLHIG